jgi:hypothetical protein
LASRSASTLAIRAEDNVTTAVEVADVHRKHPDWSVSDIALALGCNTGVVRASKRMLKLDIPEPRGGIPAEPEAVALNARPIRPSLPKRSQRPAAKPAFKKIRYAGAE